MGKCLFLRKGETHTAPISGIFASDIAVGSSVYLMENGAAVEYLVVHQGLPSNLYDVSCEGCWLLRKDILNNHQYATSKSAYYNNSLIHTYLNNTFISVYDDIKDIIKSVKIPYNTTSTIETGSNGLGAKLFILSEAEVGYYYSTPLGYTTYDQSSTKLSYFISYENDGANNRRIAYLDGVASYWFTRSNSISTNASVSVIKSNGSLGSIDKRSTYGVRPALILPSNALFDKNTLILKGVA